MFGPKEGPRRAHIVFSFRGPDRIVFSFQDGVQFPRRRLVLLLLLPFFIFNHGFFVFRHSSASFTRGLNCNNLSEDMAMSKQKLE